MRSDRKRNRAICAAALIAVLGCGDSGQSGENAEGGDTVRSAAAATLLEPGGFQIAPRSDAVGNERFDSVTGSLERLGLPLPAQLAAAWGLRVRDLHIEIELPEGPFDVRARPVDGKRESAEALIRGGLSEHFGFAVERGVWKGPVLALHLVEGGLVPQPTEAAASAGGEAGGAPGDVRRVGEYRVTGVPISDFVDFLGRGSETPVVDATGLDQHYDLAIEWDASQGGRAFQAALGDAGFELVSKRGEVERWVVRAAP